jgi:hypothetical protein
VEWGRLVRRPALWPPEEKRLGVSVEGIGGASVALEITREADVLVSIRSGATCSVSGGD